MQQYIVKCKCLQLKQACTLACKCKSCSNFKGDTELQPPMRKRNRHEWQVTIPKSALFATKLGENIPHRPKMILEYFVLECTMKHCLLEQISITPQIMFLIYNSVVNARRACARGLQYSVCLFVCLLPVSCFLFTFIRQIIPTCLFFASFSRFPTIRIR